ncbi:chemotaxis protein CheB [Exilibacterium tricleocarpae]|uniref:chemotaxis protein CheB n=1 Tax=Exilibacterium tricleocarpae TaxID=2591008 RepID=UPI0015D32A8C|nr:chemotaxis protein CheB [Exilibacterium tricleocarpae]
MTEPASHPSQRLRIGILADTSLQQHALRSVVLEFGYTVAVSHLVAQVAEPQLVAAVDAWIVHADLANAQAQELDNWLGNIAVPVIFGEGPVPPPTAQDYAGWARRLRGKLQQLAGAINLEQRAAPAAEQLWVLAASTGGPKAVDTFLCALPAGMGISFIYVQHIGAEFDRTLAQVTGRGSHYPARVAAHGEVIVENTVVVVATDKVVEILDNGTLALLDEPWPGPYQPSADQVIANVARACGERSGVIVFTGMGDDGAVGVRLMHQQGGRAWVQAPQTCTVASMPDAALATGCVDYVGSPEALALQLASVTQAAVTLKSSGVYSGNR